MVQDCEIVTAGRIPICETFVFETQEFDTYCKGVIM